ncbi:MAG TPA: hypothetical protein PKN56_00275 [Leptospiraceae bacterium]|nr:hypothetical protein [Leptospiraceae bacterium]HNF23791.1 hypothetical protein [Leptospiraceae bacterium]HNH10986.1 hypothetical protein [Leptospiraceae bacterium]HNI95401.1 hypothetical protein [Leptospiraceae bacterium]HNN01970.1 hypothetical protein [Leptospiraceae bacterium]
MKRKVFLCVSVLFLVSSFVLSLPNTDWKDNKSILNLVCLFLGTVGSAISIFIPNNYIQLFTKDFWSKTDSGDWSITVPGKVHFLGSSPKVTVFQNENGLFSEIIVDVSHTEKGEVVILSNIKFDGKAVIS